MFASTFSRISNEEVIPKANIAAKRGEDLTVTWQPFLQIKTDAKEKTADQPDSSLELTGPENVGLEKSKSAEVETEKSEVKK